jgi:tRNA A37 threonylcarbamoyltransferase TsaD
MIVGGVSANTLLQKEMRRVVTNHLPDVHMMKPAEGFYTDNAAMIAAAGSWRLAKGKIDNWKTIDAKPDWDL